MEQKTESHLKKHPFGKIPILEDNNFVLFGQYPALRFPHDLICYV